MRVLINRINDVFELNEAYTEADLVRVILRHKSFIALGESWAERERVRGMVRALTESRS